MQRQETSSPDNPDNPGNPGNPGFGYSLEMLTSLLYPELLAGQSDPAGLINARLQYVRRPTPAVVVTTYGGREFGRSPVNPQSLASAEDTTRMYAHLLSLGLIPEVKIWENSPSGPAHRVEWNGETRRFWQIGPFSVGALLVRYAGTVLPLADLETKREIEQAGLFKEVN